MAFPFNAFWLPGENHPPDERVAFRGEFHLARAATVRFRSMACGWFLCRLDGELLTEGPARYLLRKPEYSVIERELPAGRHVLAIHAQHIGVETRQLEQGDPFLVFDVLVGDEEVAVSWRAKLLDAYRFGARRISHILSWIDWCDTRVLPDGWEQPGFDDSDWQEPVRAEPKLPAPKEVRLGEIGMDVLPMELIAKGVFSEEYGYELDDPPLRFLLRDLSPEAHPAQGVWRRYDLGRVRLGRPRLVLDLAEGAVVEFGLNERLQNGRVAPTISLSSSPSANMDHFVARGGEQEFLPLTPKGGRFLEVHVIGPTGDVHFLDETFVERCYHPPTQAWFRSDDELLNRAWHIGVETYRACSEDALVDTPVRERGQWTGDAVSAGLDIAASAYTDLRLVRRSLQHAGECAREDGLVAGMCPGGMSHIPSYAAQWIYAHWRYYELTGEKALLRENFDAAERNWQYFERYWTPDGVVDGPEWNFIDWGYVRNEGPIDIAYNIHVLAALKALVKWCRVLDKPHRRAVFEERAGVLEKVLSEWFKKTPGDAIGYHSAVLGLLHGLVDESRKPACIESIKNHQRLCFPNNPCAPRLSDPGVREAQLITPYFCHFAYDALVKAGETRYVLDQVRSCYGWAMGEGRTTWVEVFDTRWSHSHQWGGCPTWLLSRYVLGLHPRLDEGGWEFHLDLRTGGLNRASGEIPLAGTETFVRVEWRRDGDRIRYMLHSPRSIMIHPVGLDGNTEEPVEVEGPWAVVLEPGQFEP